MFEDHKDVRAVHQFFERRFGNSVDHVSIQAIAPEKAIRRRRSYVRLDVTFSGRDTEQPFFAKIAARRSIHTKFDAFIGDVSLRSIRAPRFYGEITLGNGTAAVWEFVCGTPFPAIESCSSDLLAKYVAAVAEINLLTEAASDAVPALARKTRPLVPMARKIDEWLNGAKAPLSSQEVQALRSSIAQVAEWEHRAIDRISAVKPALLTHNDFSPDNILITNADGPLIVYDWETITVSAPGSGLRWLAFLPRKRQEELVDLYIGLMAKGRVEFDAGEILFALRAIQVFFSLYVALDVGDIRRLRWGLSHSAVLEY